MEGERLFFNSFVEALTLQAHHEALTPRIKERLREQGLDLDRRLAPGYRSTLLEPWLQILSQELHPSVPIDQAHQLLGKRFVSGWKETFVGRAVQPLVKLLSPKRALMRMERNFRATDNFSEIASIDRGPSTVDLDFRDVCGVPYFFLGLLQEGSTLSHARNVRCSILTQTPPGAVFRCEWDS